VNAETLADHIRRIVATAPTPEGSRAFTVDAGHTQARVDERSARETDPDGEREIEDLPEHLQVVIDHVPEHIARVVRAAPPLTTELVERLRPMLRPVQHAALSTVSEVVQPGSALAAGRSDADLLSNGKALDLIDAVAHMAATDPAAAIGNLNQVVALQAARPEAIRAKDLVYTAARRAADSNPHGHADRKTILALTPDMAASTRDKAIGDLIADGRLDRIRTGVFTIPGQHRTDPSPAADPAAA
jgi:hypothetical protein